MKNLIFFLLLVISFSSFALDVYLPKAPPSLPLAKSAKNIKDLNLKYYNDVVTEVIPNIIIKNIDIITIITIFLLILYIFYFFYILLKKNKIKKLSKIIYEY